MTRPLRVLHCPTNVGGHPGSLARAERELGLASWAVAFEPTSGLHDVDEVLRPGGTGRARFEARRWCLLLRALRDFDVVHFNFGRSILPERPTWPAPRPAHALYGRALALRDLPLLRRAGKGLAVTFQGDDARRGDVLEARGGVSIATENPGYYAASGDTVKRRALAVWDRYADRIFYLNPDLGHLLPGRAEFLPYAHVDPRGWAPPPARAGARPLLVHAPTDRGVKGTRHVVEAVERLRSEGVAFDFELVEGRTRAEARRIYERADLCVDQLLAGWYGGVAVELMALGKPVIAFLREDDLRFVPQALRTELPVVSATPATLHEVLGRMLRAPGELPELGARSRAYVERWHDPRRVAERTRDAYGRGSANA